MSPSSRRAAAGDAVDDLVVDADAGGRGVAVVALELGRRAVRADHALDLGVDLRRRDAGRAIAHGRVERDARDAPGLAQELDLAGGLEDDHPAPAPTRRPLDARVSCDRLDLRRSTPERVDLARAGRALRGSARRAARSARGRRAGASRMHGLGVVARPRPSEALDDLLVVELEVDDGVDALGARAPRRAPRPGATCAGSRRGGSPSRRRASRCAPARAPITRSSGTSSPASMNAFALRPSRRPRRDRGAQEVAGREVQDAERARRGARPACPCRRPGDRGGRGARR